MTRKAKALPRMWLHVAVQQLPVLMLQPLMQQELLAEERKSALLVFQARQCWSVDGIGVLLLELTHDHHDDDSESSSLHCLAQSSRA